jgi:light-regulated signal transduction histidine kinase (bacteriophytochrome)
VTSGERGGQDKLLEEALFEVKRVIVGQDRMVERMFTAVLARGHCLLQGVPGVAKTLADDQARVFDRFWRAKGNGGGRDRHAGLGLAIVRQIVESHAGQVRLFSRVGEGSTFVLWFPAPGAEQAGGGPPEDQPPELS